MIHQLLKSTRDTHFRTMAQAEHSDSGLHLVAFRLLMLALTVTGGKSERKACVGMAVPCEYRTWPRMEFDGDLSGSQGGMSLYVSPKCAATADGEPFPLGTVIVVERYKSQVRKGNAPLSLFVMGKVVSVTAHPDLCGCSDGWAYATYQCLGRAGRLKSAASGVCRVSLGFA